MTYTDVDVDATTRTGRACAAAVPTHLPCPDYPGQWHDYSTGACTCGAAHTRWVVVSN